MQIIEGVSSFEAHRLFSHFLPVLEELNKLENLRRQVLSRPCLVCSHKHSVNISSFFLPSFLSFLLRSNHLRGIRLRRLAHRLRRRLRRLLLRRGGSLLLRLLLRRLLRVLRGVSAVIAAAYRSLLRLERLLLALRRLLARLRGLRVLGGLRARVLQLLRGRSVVASVVSVEPFAGVAARTRRRLARRSSSTLRSRSSRSTLRSRSTFGSSRSLRRSSGLSGLSGRGGSTGAITVVTARSGLARLAVGRSGSATIEASFQGSLDVKQTK